jgi:hypothetical protein
VVNGLPLELLGLLFELLELLEEELLELLELLSAPTFTIGTGVPGLRRNAADGRSLVAAVHGGTTTSRVPSPCGSDSAVEPVVAITAFTLCDVTFAPVSHGVTTTVRVTSVGTTTRREPSFTFVVPLLLTSRPPITKIAISPTITDAATRFPGIRGGAASCSVSEPIAPPGVQLLLLDDDGAVHGEAVAVEEPFDGITVLC